MGGGLLFHARTRTVLALTGLAAGFGLVAGWLSSPSREASGYFLDSIPFTAASLDLVAYLTLGALTGYLLYRTYLRLTQPTMPVPRRLLTGFVVAFVLATLFATVGPLVAHHSSQGAGTSPSAPSDAAVGQSAPGSSSSAVPGPASPASAPPASPSGTLLIVGLAVAAASAIVIVLGWRWLGRGWKTRLVSRAGTGAAIGPELLQLVEKLDLARLGRERTTVVRAYAELLTLLAQRRERVVELTPREIEGVLVSRFHLDRMAAQELTALFEEARYSTHRLEPAVANRAPTLLRRLEYGLPALPRPLFEPPVTPLGPSGR
ncbi:MAG: DUF4129 domain-containing protein [Thermoplasmata archaeon]|nr:DUF4129 domain-containing protein [Thermoplasmata archaeon]